MVVGTAVSTFLVSGAARIDSSRNALLSVPILSRGHAGWTAQLFVMITLCTAQNQVAFADGRSAGLLSGVVKVAQNKTPSQLDHTWVKVQCDD